MGAEKRNKKRAYLFSIHWSSHRHTSDLKITKNHQPKAIYTKNVLLH